MQDAGNQNRRAISLFLFVTLLTSSVFYLLIIHSGKLGSVFGIYVTGLMWCPGISAIITCKLLKRKVSTLEWQWGKTRYQLWSYAIPFFYTAITYLIVWLTGLGGFFNRDFVKEISTTYGWEQVPPNAIVFIYIILMGFYGMAGSASDALGEEIGWRGFLVPELFKTHNYTQTSFISGVIWALWHFPVILFADYNSGTPEWYGLTCFTIQIISTSFIINWFRLKSKSLWTSVLLHASHNLFIQAIFNPLTIDTGHTSYFTDEFGTILPIVCSVFAFYFWRRRRELSIYAENTLNSP